MSSSVPQISSIYHSQSTRNPLIQAVLLLAVTMLFGWFVLLPKYNNVTVERSELSQLKQQRATLDEDSKILNALIVKMEASPGQIKLLDEAVPLTSRPTQIALLLENYANSVGLQIAQINIDDIDKKASITSADALNSPYTQERALITSKVSMLVSGNTEQFKAFLQVVETSGRLIDVELLEIAEAEDITSFRVKLKMYSYQVK